MHAPLAFVSGSGSTGLQEFQNLQADLDFPTGCPWTRVPEWCSGPPAFGFAGPARKGHLTHPHA